jgi:transposase
MQYYIGLDVSQRQTAIFIIDQNGKILAEGKALTLPSDIYSWLKDQRIEIAAIEKIGLESGAMSNGLYLGLTRPELPVLCLEAFQAHRFL